MDDEDLRRKSKEDLFMREENGKWKMDDVNLRKKNLFLREKK